MDSRQARNGERYDVFDDGMMLRHADLSKREAWDIAAAQAGSTVLPHECTPDCRH